MAGLSAVLSNETQKFNVNDFSFYCKPYGVIALEELYGTSQSGSTCRESINKLYTKKPFLKDYSAKHLKIKQRYHLEFRDKKCILYAKGEISLSELLLKNGLALMRPHFKDKEFYYLFKKAELEAKLNKLGMWNENIDTKCITAIYKD
ncbi:thermonuclease family protein [bacterium]|nr:thermonuclease family protein [bacterium]MBU1989175.1 thermonuclease family protein [bacterium]